MKDSYMNVVVSQLGKSTDNVSIHTKDSPKCTDDSFSKTIEKSTVKLAEKDSYDRQEPVSEELDASKTEVVYEDDGQVYEEEPKVEETEEYAQNLTLLIPKKEAVDVACEFANEQKGMFQEAGQQMQTAICEQLNISEEEFEQVMEELGITVFELFNPAQLAEFVMKVSGIEDAGQLLVTSDFVQLKHQVEGIQNELMEKTGLVEAMNQPKKVDKNEVRDFILKTASYLEQPEQMVEPEVNVHPQAQSSEEQNGQMTLMQGQDVESISITQEKQPVVLEGFENKAQSVQENIKPLTEENVVQTAESTQPTEESEEEPLSDELLQKLFADSSKTKTELGVEKTNAVVDGSEEAVYVEGEQPEEMVQDVEDSQTTLEMDTNEVSKLQKVGKRQETSEHRQENHSEQNHGHEAPVAKTSSAPVVTGTEQTFDANALEQPMSFTETPVVRYVSTPASELLQRVAEQIRMVKASGETSIEMQINPESLGKVYIHVTAKEGVVNAQIQASTEAAKEMLDMQMAELRDNLNQAGVKVDAIEVTVSSHAFEQNLEQNAKREEQQAQQQAKYRQRSLRSGELDGLSGLLSEEEALAAQIMKDHGNTMDIMA